MRPIMRSRRVRDPHLVAKADFIGGVAEHLNHAAGSHEFDRLVLVAPPRSLGELQRHLGADAAAKVTAAFGKDLTRLPLTELDEHLAAMSQAPH